MAGSHGVACRWSGRAFFQRDLEETGGIVHGGGAGHRTSRSAGGDFVVLDFPGGEA
jgi:hypothetical protein